MNLYYMHIILNIDILGYKQNGEPRDQKVSLGSWELLQLLSV